MKKHPSDKFFKGMKPVTKTDKEAKCLMSSPSKLNQHYVPKRYLKNFTTLEGKENINVFCVLTDVRRPANIRRVACAPAFYGFPPCTHDEVFKDDGTWDRLVFDKLSQPFKTSVEQALKAGKQEDIINGLVYENLFASDYEEPGLNVVETILSQLNMGAVIKNPKKKWYFTLTWPQKLNLVKFIALQLLRTPKVREIITLRVKRDLLRKEPHRIVRNLGWVWPRMDELGQVHHLAYIMDEIRSVTSSLLIREMNIVVNFSEVPFITSDHPAIWFDTSNINETNCIIPLSPNIAIIFHTHAEIPYNLNSWIRVADKNLVRTYNNQQYLNTTRNLYANRSISKYNLFNLIGLHAPQIIV